jgi:hypothetical protein
MQAEYEREVVGRSQEPVCLKDRDDPGEYAREAYDHLREAHRDLIEILDWLDDPEPKPDCLANCD